MSITILVAGEGALAAFLQETLKECEAWRVRSVPDLKALDKFGAPGVVVLAGDGKATRRSEAALRRLLRKGGGVVALPPALEALRGNRGMQDLLGCPAGSLAAETEVLLKAQDPGDPIFRGFQDFRLSDRVALLKGRLKSDLTVHGFFHWDGRRYPAVFSRPLGKGRICVLALGGKPGALGNDLLKRVLWRCIAYSGGTYKTDPIATVVAGGGTLDSEVCQTVQRVQAAAGFSLRGVVTETAEERLSGLFDLEEVKCYKSIEKVAADPEVQLVVLQVPPSKRGPSALRLIKAGKHVVAPQPLALSLREFDAAIRAARRRNVIFSSLPCGPEAGDFEVIKEAVAQDLLGDVFHVEAGAGRFEHPDAGWRSDKRLAGSLFDVQGAELIDWILQLVQAPVQSVTAYLQKRVWHDVSIDDWGSLILKFADGRTAMAEVGTAVGACRPKWRILGTRGAVWAEWAMESVTFIYYRNGIASTTRTPVKEKQPDSQFVPVLDAVAAGLPLQPGSEHARRVVAVLEAARRSAKTGKPVGLAL